MATVANLLCKLFGNTFHSSDLYVKNDCAAIVVSGMQPVKLKVIGHNILRDSIDIAVAMKTGVSQRLLGIEPLVFIQSAAQKLCCTLIPFGKTLKESISCAQSRNQYDVHSGPI